MKPQSKQEPISNQAELQKASDELPGQFLDLANKIDYTKWTCDDTLKAKIQLVVELSSDDLTKIGMTGSLIDNLDGPDLYEVANSSYAFGHMAGSSVLLADTLTVCSQQQDLGKQFNVLADKFTDGWEVAHELEMTYIEAYEDQQRQRQEPQSKPIPKDRNDKT